MVDQVKHLSTAQINNFIDQGFISIDQAFPTEIADECRAILWKTTNCDPDDTSTWTQPVIRIGELALEPFRKAANTEILTNAFDQLAGKGNWLPRQRMGSFPIRFPGIGPANDTGWHVDASFPGDDPDNYLEWRINVYSKGRALLMLFLFSDVSEQDAPTILRIGSHGDVAKILAPEGEKGLSFMELAQELSNLPKRQTALATGRAGTVYLCHPFMAQPALLTRQDFTLNQSGDTLSPVEKAILLHL